MPFWNKLCSAPLALALGLASAAAAETSAPPGKVVERIVAVANGSPILLSELEEAKLLFASGMKEKVSSPDFERNVLDQVINERLLTQEIDRRGLTANEAAVDRAVESVMQQNGFKTIEELRQALRTEGMTLEEYRTSVKKQMETSRLVNTAIRPKVQVTDQDVDTALRRSAEAAPTGWKSDVSMILKKKPAATRKSVERLRRQIGAGVPFATVAARETEGPAKNDGGHIGWVFPADLQPELGRVIERMKPGEISEVIETKQGFYLLHVTERKEAPLKPEQIDREKLRADLEKAEIDRNLELFVKGLRERAHVEIKL